VLASQVPCSQLALGPTIDNRTRDHWGTTYLDENLPTSMFGRCRGPSTLVKGVLNVVQLHDLGHQASGHW